MKTAFDLAKLGVAALFGLGAFFGSSWPLLGRLAIAIALTAPLIGYLVMWARERHTPSRTA